jgi:hypothetical protein
MASGVGGWQSCWSVTATTYPRLAERNLGRQSGSRWWVLAFRSREPGAGQTTAPGRGSTPSADSPAELLHVLMLPDFDRADSDRRVLGYPKSRVFAELLIDCEEDRTLRAVLVGMLRDRRQGSSP